MCILIALLIFGIRSILDRLEDIEDAIGSIPAPDMSMFGIRRGMMPMGPEGEEIVA